MEPNYVHLVITFADDTVGVMAFVTQENRMNGDVAWKRKATDEAINAEIDRTNFGDGKKPIKGWRKIRKDSMPTDRTYRNAWRDKNSKIEVHMPAAREIHRNLMRHAREYVMPALDVDFMRATEAEDFDKIKEVVDQKQFLRDVTADPAIEKAKTPEELKKVWPEELGELNV